MKKILIVDDEIFIISVFKRILMDYEFHILTADSGEEALEILNENKDIKVIISDMNMIDMNGLELLETAMETVPDSRRIILTGDRDGPSLKDALNKGIIHHCIKKPWKDEEIIDIVAG